MSIDSQRSWAYIFLTCNYIYFSFYIIDINFFVIYFSEICKSTPIKSLMDISLPISFIRLETVKAKNERKYYRIIRRKFRPVLLAFQKVRANILLLLFICRFWFSDCLEVWCINFNKWNENQVSIILLNLYNSRIQVNSLCMYNNKLIKGNNCVPK